MSNPKLTIEKINERLLDIEDLFAIGGDMYGFEYWADGFDSRLDDDEKELNEHLEWINWLKGQMILQKQQIRELVQMIEELEKNKEDKE